MAEYIEREAVRELIRCLPIMSTGRIKENEVLIYMDAVADTKKQILEEVSAIPAADVVPVVHGRWVNMLIARVDTTGDCTNCGKEAVWRTRNKPYAICPNCGARMEVTNNENLHLQRDISG